MRSRKTKAILGLSMMAVMAQTQAFKPYHYPTHRDVSINNYSQMGFQKAKEPHRFQAKSEIQVGDEIMAYDRYQRIWNKQGPDDFEYVTSISRLDRVEVLDLNDETENNFIKVKVVSSNDYALVGKTYYTWYKGLSEYQSYKEFDTDIYIIQNVATEKLRVYQRICKDMSCPPKMIFETDFVAGLKKGDDDFKYNTHVGSYRIFEWEKFYQDKGTGGHYPSWFDASYPAQPGPEDNWSDWFKSDVMPWEYCEGAGEDQKCSYSGMMRGAFGWYTALVEPHYGSGQWTHGTIGWGKSSQEMISRAKGEDFFGALANIFTSLRSSGCSRVSNPAVAFLRHIAPPGTPLIKIYALEAYQDQASMEQNYYVGMRSKWDYVLTKDGVRENGEAATSAHRNYVVRRNLNTFDNILEEGAFEFNVYPSVVQEQNKPKKRGGYSWFKGCVEDTTDNYLSPGQVALEHEEKRKYIDPAEFEDTDINSRDCNVYKIPATAFKGRFYVDTGLIDGYSHPEAEGVIRGGFRSENWPSFIEVNNYR